MFRRLCQVKLTKMDFSAVVFNAHQLALICFCAHKTHGWTGPQNNVLTSPESTAGTYS